MPLSVDDVFMRQTQLFHPGKHQRRVNIFGVGTVGSFTALALAKLGLKYIDLWDADAVEIHNCPNQLHPWRDVGRQKVESTKRLIEHFCEGMDEVEPEVTAHDEFYEGQTDLEGVVISAADLMSARQTFWDKVRMNLNVSLFIDTRMAGQGFRLYSILPHDPDHIELYESSLYTDEESSEVPCGERSCIDMGFLIASRVTRSVRRYLGEGLVEPFIVEDVRSLDLINATGKVEKAA